MLYEAVVIAVIMSMLTKGSIKNLAKLEFKYIILIFISFLLKYLLDYFTIRGYHFSVIQIEITQFIAYLSLFLFLALNIKVPGMKIMFLGMFMNFLVIMANNGTMPATINGLDAYTVDLLINNKNATHSLFTQDTRLPWLADIFTQKFPQEAKFSIGDVLISIGVFYLVWATMHAKEKMKSYRLESFLYKK